MSEQVVLVTGGGRGIGRCICRKFAADGAQTVAVARSASDLAETRALVEGDGGKCHVETTDLTEHDEIDALVETVISKFGHVDVLVNCAGIAPLTDVEHLDPDVFQTIMAVNVDAVYYLSRAVWPNLVQRGGVIVNISSAASMDPFPGLTAYGAAKAWVNTWTKGLAGEGKPHDIRVYAVAPGAVETKMLRDAFPGYPQDQTLAPEDVANVVYALSQPGCRYVSGETILVRK